MTFIYTEQTNIPIELALDVLFVADMLLIDKLKAKAATVISTVSNTFLCASLVTRYFISIRRTLDVSKRSRGSNWF